MTVFSPFAMHHFNLSSLFGEVLGAYEDRPALHYEGGSFTFGELGGLADALADLLLARGLQRGDVIAIGHNKHPLSFALMIAALRIGVAYVNVDVASPIARNRLILEACRPAALFVDDSAYWSEMAELAALHGCELLMLEDSLLPVVCEGSRERQRRCSGLVDGQTIAYVMFTSGSTGVPKGVAVTHESVLHFIAWGRERFGISERDNFANLSPMYFDNSVFDFYVGLFCGAALSPVHRDLLAKPYDLVDYVTLRSCTIWFSVPSALIYLNAMKAFTPGALIDLRAIVFGGEGYPKVELKKLFDRFRSQAELTNVYGPTECTCICSSHTLALEDFENLEGLPTLGHLNPNFDYRILDVKGQDASEGELCLIGPNVAAGYFNDPERTSAAFSNILDSNRFMKRMYRTGDLVKEVDGRLYFLGRRDNQVKHMGYRIELEEIENAFVQLPEVDQAAVIYQRCQTAYGRLIAFVACAAEADANALLEALGQLVPEYMVPSKVVVMPSLPKSANGKVDREHLRNVLGP